jgi:AraC-like DNA-binding protein
LLRRLANHSDVIPLAAATERHRRLHRVVSRLERVTAHIEENFRSALTVSDVARVAALTPNGFSRLFRRMTNQTFVAYRNARRIREACCLLSESDESITRIAGECGFENLANFNRQFRQILGMTPREYRRMHHRPPALAR